MEKTIYSILSVAGVIAVFAALWLIFQAATFIPYVPYGG
jgi:hypothetical protein